MGNLKDMPLPGLIVIVVIVLLFFVSIGMLSLVYRRYRKLSWLIDMGAAEDDDFLSGVKSDFQAAYKTDGAETNTPVIIQSAMASGLAGSLFCERFLNNAVSLFVTLGLFGTFLGLSLSVASLTQLISYSNTSEWLSVLDSVGGGLMSALSGMGVAFYTSLVGAACSILLTVFRTIFSPQSQREKLAVQTELWLDHTVAPTLPTDSVKDEPALIQKMICAMDKTAASMEKSLSDAGADLRKTIEGSRPYLAAFHQTVEKFNSGVHDYAEVDYNLRGSVERMDLAIRDLVQVMKKAGSVGGNGAEA